MAVYKIKEIMKSRGIGNKELAQKSGIPLGTLNKIIYGDTDNPTLGNMQAIAQALDCKLDDFVNPTYTPQTIAAHHDAKDWTQEELDEIEKFKEYVRARRELK